MNIIQLVVLAPKGSPDLEIYKTIRSVPGSAIMLAGGNHAGFISSDTLQLTFNGMIDSGNNVIRELQRFNTELAKIGPGIQAFAWVTSHRRMLARTVANFFAVPGCNRDYAQLIQRTYWSEVLEEAQNKLLQFRKD